MSKTSAFVFALSAAAASQDGSIWSPWTSCPPTNPTEWTNCGNPGLKCVYHMDHGLGPVWDYVCDHWFMWERIEPGQCYDAEGYVFECDSSNGADENLGAAGNRHQPYRSEKLGAAGNRHQPYRSERLGDGQPCDGSPETCEGAACGSSLCTLTTWSGHMCVPRGTTTNPSNVGIDCAVRETAICGQGPEQAAWFCENIRVGAAGNRHQPYRSENLGAAGNRHQPYRSENPEAAPAPEKLGAAGNRHQPYRSERLGDGENTICNSDQCMFFGNCMAQGTYTLSEGLPDPRACNPTGWAVCTNFTPYQPISDMQWACATHAPAQGAPMAVRN